MIEIMRRTLPFMLLAALMATMAARTAWAQADLAAILRQHYDAANKGDVAAAVAFFTDDATLIRGGCTHQIPCKGKTEIQRQIQNEVNGQSRVDIISSQASGITVTARIESRNLNIKNAGIERAIFNVTATFSGDKISRLVSERDDSDSQTAVFANFQRVREVNNARGTAFRRGDVAAVMGFYTDDVMLEGFGLCAAAPCVGKAAIQKEIERQVADKFAGTEIPGTARVSGDTLTFRSEVVSDSIKAAGVERIIVSLTTVVKGDKISSIRYVLDLSDAQTAKFAAAQKLPKSGGDASPNEAWLMALAGIIFLAGGYVLRRLRV